MTKHTILNKTPIEIFIYPSSGDVTVRVSDRGAYYFNKKEWKVFCELMREIEEIKIREVYSSNTHTKNIILDKLYKQAEALKDESIGNAIQASEGSIQPARYEIEAEIAHNNAIKRVLELIKELKK